MTNHFPFARFLLWIPPLLWYRIIWGFSAQTASASGKVSDGLLHRILSVLSPAYARSEADIQGAAVEVLSFFERKAAHMFLYFLLVILLLVALAPFVRNILHRSAAAGVFCAVLAVLDEIHQTFIPGRSGAARDVAVDLAGAAIAYGIWFLLRWVGVIRRDRRRLPAIRTWMPAGIGLLSACILPNLTQSTFGHPAFESLCQRFLENWETLDAAGKTAVLEGISPVMREMLYAGTAGVLGLMAILTPAMRRWPLPRSIIAAVSAVTLAAVCLAVLHSCCLIPGLLAAATGVLLGSMVWAGCILIVKSRELLLHKEFRT